MKITKIILSIILISSVCFSQGASGTDAKYEYRNLVDLPSAGILEKGFVGVTLDVLPKGVLISKLEVGVFDNFSFGVSYGGSNVIGTGVIDWYKIPGVNARLRILNETEGSPALTFGFDSQGKGQFFDEDEPELFNFGEADTSSRYEIKSPGFFVAVAKNFEFLGYLSLHGVVNYTLENNDDKDLNFGFGVEKTLGGKVSLVAEYDFALNDNGSGSIGDGDGYLNMGVRWAVGDGFTIGLDLRNMLDNKKLNANKSDRAIFVEYIKGIF